MIYSPKERGSRWSLFVQRQYQKAKDSGKATTYKEFGALIGVTDVTIGKWMKGGFCDDINLWVALSEFSGTPIGEMKDLIYGSSKVDGGNEPSGEFLTLAYLESASPSVLWRILQAVVSHLSAHMPIADSALSPSTIAPALRDDAGSVSQTTSIMYSAAKLAHLLATFVNPNDPDEVAEFVEGLSEFQRVSVRAAIAGEMTDAELDDEIFLRDVRYCIVGTVDDDTPYTIDWLKAQIETPPSSNGSEGHYTNDRPKLPYKKA